MDAARREKKEHGTLAFPFQIYPALDGSEADDSDFIPYHWHPGAGDHHGGLRAASR